MEKTIFKIGATVERIEGSHVGMKIGDRDEITSVLFSCVMLKNYRGSSGQATHSKSSLKLVNKIEFLQIW